MSKVTVSPKYQVVIPKEIRSSTRIKPGTKMVVLLKGNVIYMVPERPIQELRGIAKGISAGSLREKKDRF